MPQKLNAFKDVLFETIFKHAYGGIAIVGLDGRWIMVNQSIVDFLGYSEEELKKISFQDITHKDDLELDVEKFYQLLEGKIEHYRIEKRYFHKKGHVIWAILSVALVRDADDQPLYFISQIVDITKKKEISWQMELLLKIVKGQNQKLSDFAQIAAHDIRSHVGNLDTITSFIEEEHKTIATEENFMMLKEALLNLNETLAHLNEARIDNLMTNDQLKSLNLHAFAENAIYNVAAIAMNTNCTILNNINPSFQVLGLEIYLDSIILNFLTNAIKYRTENRLPVIELNAMEKDNCVVLEIKDNGLGMDLKAVHDKIFKLNGTFHNHKDSRGVGLFITKNHIESIGGKIEVFSEVGVGSRFLIYFQKA